MTAVIRKTDIFITTPREATGVYGREYFKDVKSFAVDHGVLQFEQTLEKETTFMQTNRPFTVLTRTSLSCGHKIESYKCDLRYGQPENERCKECDEVEISDVPF